MATIIFDKPAPDLDEITGKLQLVISPSRLGLCFEDFTNNFKCTGAKNVGNRFLLEKKTGSIIVKIAKTGGKLQGKKVLASEVSKLKYAVLAAKNYKDIRLCEDGVAFGLAYGLEFDNKFERDPEGRSFDNCDRFIKFHLSEAKGFYVGMYRKDERLSLRFYHD